MHRLLLRQLKRSLLELESLPQELIKFLDLVNDAYEQFDDERELLDRSLKISSNELFQRNTLMRAVFMALPDAFLWITHEGLIKDCKGGVRQLFGLEAASLFNRNICEVTELADSIIFTSALQELNTSRFFQAEYALHRGENIRHFEARFATLDPQHYLVLIRDISDRTRAEETLRLTQERLDHIIEFLPDSILAVDSEHRVIAWNKALEEMTGVPKDEILGKGDYEYALPFYGERRPVLLDFIGKDPSEYYSMYVQDSTRPDTLMTEVFVPALYGKRGAYVWARATPLYDENGNVAGAIQSIRDITEKKRAELTTQVLYLASTLASTPMSNSDLFANVYEILKNNLGASAFYITLLNPIDGQQQYPFFDDSYQHGKDLQSPLELTQEVIQSNQPIHKPCTRHETFPCYWVGIPLKSGEKILGALAVQFPEKSVTFNTADTSLLTAIADHLTLAVTRNATETALRLSEEKHRSIFENATEGMFQVSLDHTLLNANPAMAPLLGYPDVAALMDDANDFLRRYVPHSDRLHIFDQLLRIGKIAGYELCSAKHDGSKVWFSLNMRAVKRPDGTIRHLEGSLEDISQRKEAERKLAIQKSQFQQLFDNSPQGIMLLGADGTPTDLNRAFTELFGYTLDNLTDIYETILPPTELNQSFTFLTSVLNGRIMSSETFRKHQDGRTIPVSLLGYPYLLDGKISGAFFIFSDISERKHYEEQLTQQALRDSLTGLPNRVLFLDRLNQAMGRQKRRDQYLFAVLMIDLDSFKRVNDSLGHQAGDILLQEVAQRLSNCLRSMDTVARMGGDEFAVLLEDFQDQQEAIEITRRLLAEVRQPLTIMGRAITVSASVGVVLNTDRYSSPDDLLRDADISMYRSKELGKNQFKVFSKTMYDQIIQTVQLEQDLRRAIAHDELELYFQPIFTIADRTLYGFEGLMRWNHPEQGLITPNRFIHIAEEAGLITDLTRWALRQGSRIMAHWNENFFTARNLTISINLSPRDLAHPNLLGYVSEVLQDTAIGPEQLKLEITETAVMDHPDQAIVKLDRLKKLGIQLAMDDFGTGYSSLSYLHRFPIDTIKIDRSFVHTMLENPSNLEIIKTILGLGKILGLHIVAEGVETEDQLKVLKDLQCDFAQGYLLGRPLPRDKAEAILSDMEQRGD